MSNDDDNPSSASKPSETFDALLRSVARSESREPPSNEDLVGSTLGHYRVVAKLGRGGMGIVYRAEDERLARDVALKVLPPSLAGDEERRRRFLREARSAAAINHPNIATIYEVGEVEGRLFLAMERVEGRTLRARIAEGAIDPAEALPIARQIALGLARAHEKGIVHRDLKPENVMLTRHGDVKLLDFGLAKLRDPISNDDAPPSGATLTQEGRVMGTPGYMSPEQATGKPVDARADVYSLGVVLHEMLTGALPALGSGKVAAEPGMAALITRCLAHERENRPASAGDVLAELDALAAGAQGSAAPKAEGPSRGGGGARTLAVVAAVAVVVVLAALSLRARLGAGASRAPLSAPASASAETAVTPPLPTAGKPEAIEAYKEALGARRGAEVSRVLALLRKAIDLDPTLPAPLLRLALLLDSNATAESRDLLARAGAHRDLLAPRDAELLLAAEALWARDPADTKAYVRMLGAAVEHAPRDADLRQIYAGALAMNGDLEEAVRQADRVLALDPGFAAAYALRSHVLALQHDETGSRRVASECVDRFPRAWNCLDMLRTLDASEGRCADEEAVIRRELAIDPESAGGFHGLLDALAAQGRSAEVVAAVFDQALERDPSPHREEYRLAEGWQIAVMYGRFGDADRMAKELLAERPTDLDLARMAWWRRVEIAEELGDRRAAVPIVREALRREAAWNSTGEFMHGQLLAVALRVGAIDRAEFDREIAAWRPRVSAVFWPQDEHPPTDADRFAQWVALYAWVAVSPGDLDDVRSRLDHGGFEAATRTDALDYEDAATLGGVLLRSGRFGAAVAPLRRAAGYCDVTTGPGLVVRATLQLGEALEATGDVPGACASYARVLFYWGAAPRSVTADEARARSSKLGCRGK